MALPDAKTLLGMGRDGGDEDEADDLADTLREFHGHMSTGNYKGAASAMRAAYAICGAEKNSGKGGMQDIYKD